MCFAAPMFPRIAKVPIGAVPLWVRQAWVGLDLPLTNDHAVTTWSQPVTAKSGGYLAVLWGVLSGKQTCVTGYSVSALAAVAVLQDTDAEAAAWWRKNTPFVLAGQRNFLFDLDCGALVAREVPDVKEAEDTQA